MGFDKALNAIVDLVGGVVDLVGEVVNLVANIQSRNGFLKGQCVSGSLGKDGERQRRVKRCRWNRVLSFDGGARDKCRSRQGCNGGQVHDVRFV